MRHCKQCLRHMWFIGKNIESSASKCMALQQLNQCLLINHRASTDINQITFRAHRKQNVPRDESCGVCPARTGDDQTVTPSGKFHERRIKSIAQGRFGTRPVVSQQKAEGLTTLGNRLTDSSHAHNPNAFALKRTRKRHRAFEPGAITDKPIRLRNLPQARQ